MPRWRPSISVERLRLPTDYSSRIKALRRNLGLSQERLADLLGVSFASINRWENEKSRPTVLAWRRIMDAERFGLAALVHADDGTATTHAREKAPSKYATAPPLDFLAQPDHVWVVAEGERLSHGHIYNPTFATETSVIDPLPHQRIAVYEHMLPQPRLRFLLADDAGAGKTIMTGLYIREILARRLIRRVLIIPPAGLVGNWRRELRLLFGLPVRILRGDEAVDSNPFIGPDSDLVIVSIDTLASRRMRQRLQDPEVTPYDLVVFDEAHKLSAHRDPDLYIRKTDRYKLAEALAGVATDDPEWQLSWSTNHLLLLTATPHMGKDFPYYCLWKLLQPHVVSTFDAFNAYPAQARQQHFIRRMKEEMRLLDGRPMYPQRISDTLSYDLTQGDLSEQALYDATTAYMQEHYSRARVLNRAAAQLAMSVFQRRLASSTYALLRSLERRLDKLETLTQKIKSGELTLRDLQKQQQTLDRTQDVLLEKTADEERAEDGREENETAEDVTLGGVVATTLADLESERQQIQDLSDLARRVHDLGHESKFLKLAEILKDPRYRDEKLIIFTEHRDTMDFLVRRLEGLGFAGQVSRIHGGMPFEEREAQVDSFRKPAREGGATYLVATDAAGEGINLQFCWVMVNYDIPWNPARLEQRLGRIHRYGQKHDPVVILNLIAGKTREGRVLHILLDKLERIRKEMGSDKVFDVVGRLFEGVSIREYMEQALTDRGATDSTQTIEGLLTAEQVRAIEERERKLFTEGGDVKPHLPRLRQEMERDVYLRLLPGYVRRYIEKTAPLLDLRIEGDLDGLFSVAPGQPGALDSLWPVLESYLPQLHDRLTLYKPSTPGEAIFVHPGEPVFESLRRSAEHRLANAALRGAVFVDPTALHPYLLHIALVTIERKLDPDFRDFARSEVLESRLIGLKHVHGGQIESFGVEHLLLLKGTVGVPPSAFPMVAQASASRDQAAVFAVENVARPIAEKHRRHFLETLAVREDFVIRGFQFQDAELAEQRARAAEKARDGDPEAKARLTRIRDQQKVLAARRDEALAVLLREPELIGPGEIRFIAHALVVPSNDPEDQRRHDAEIEAIGMRVVRAYEEALGGVVTDVSKPQLSRAAGLGESPGFDLHIRRPNGEERAVEVKARARVGDIEVTENEWAKACNLRDRYWLYVTYDCATAQPRLIRIQDPFVRLLVRAKGSVIIGEEVVLSAAISD